MPKFNDIDLTYSEAIEQVMISNGFFAPLKILYEKIWDYKDKSKIIGKTPNMTIQERVQRDPKFTRIGKGVYALSSFLDRVKSEELGFFTVDNEKQMIFEKSTEKVFSITEKITKQKVRTKQSYFRDLLLNDMKMCPITGIDDKRMLIASHIKPWVHSNNLEKVNVKNGILLSPLFDKLFDSGVGLITFSLKKEILISSKLSKENVSRLSIVPNQVIDSLDLRGREEFVKYHQKYIFQE